MDATEHEPHFSVAQPVSPRGRSGKGLRGMAGMPTHPALVHFPIVGYVFAAVFDLISILVRTSHPEVAEELFHAATWAMLGGAAVSLLAAITGAADWLSTEPGTQVRRTANTHALLMLWVTGVVLVDLGLRLFRYNHAAYTQTPILVLSLVAGAVVLLGAAYGGALVFEHGFNVEAAASTDAWTHSVIDLTTSQLEGTKTLPEQESPEPTLTEIREERERRVEGARVHPKATATKPRPTPKKSTGSRTTSRTSTTTKRAPARKP